MHRTAKVKSYLLYNSVSSSRLQLKSCQSAYSFVRYRPLFFNVSQFLSQDAWRKRTKPNEVLAFSRSPLRCRYAWVALSRSFLRCWYFSYCGIHGFTETWELELVFCARLDTQLYFRTHLSTTLTWERSMTTLTCKEVPFPIGAYIDAK